MYDAGRELTTIIEPSGCVTKYAYSLAGTGSHTMLHAIEDPRGFRTTYMYNAAKQVASRTAARQEHLLGPGSDGGDRLYP